MVTKKTATFWFPQQYALKPKKNTKRDIDLAYFAN